MDSKTKKICYNIDELRRTVFCVDGKYHNEDGPAIITHKNGKIIQEEYCLNGHFHRENGPAFICYDLKGKVIREIYFSNGRVHREDGPADIHYKYDEENEIHTIWREG